MEMPDVDMQPATRSPDFDRLDLQPRVSKQLLEGVSLEDLDNWPQFASQVRLMLDGAFPFAGTWIRAVTSLEKPPTAEWLANTALTCETTMEMIWLFLREMWGILRMRVAGRGHEIILHVAETHKCPRTRPESALGLVPARTRVRWTHLGQAI